MWASQGGVRVVGGIQSTVSGLSRWFTTLGVVVDVGLYVEPGL